MRPGIGAPLVPPVIAPIEAPEFNNKMSSGSRTSVVPRSVDKVSSGRIAAPTAKVFVADHNSESVIRLSLSNLGVDDAEFTKGTVETASAALAADASPRLLVVDLREVNDPLASIKELATKCEPNVKVVAVGDRNDIDLYRTLKEAGVAEYCFTPLIQDVLKRTFSGILSEDRTKSAASRSGKLIIVLGVRGSLSLTSVFRCEMNQVGVEPRGKDNPGPSPSIFGRRMRVKNP
jgi:pilus assembly protein CpaE